MLQSVVADPGEKGIEEVVFAVTSANHANSRYNPVPFHYRAIGIDRFARAVLSPLGISWSIVSVPHLLPTENFAKRVVAFVNAEREGRTPVSPTTTSIISSAAPLIRQFRALDFTVETAEYDELSGAYTTFTPQILLANYGTQMAAWHSLPELRDALSPSTTELWQVYPNIPQEIERLWKESLLTDQGDITETRNYGTYTASMSRSEVIELKYKDIAAGIVAGRIVDEGCADGALLSRIARDFQDSDLIGVEITREFLAQAHERQRRGDFGSSFVFFYQRNLSEKVFEDNSVDTTICNSTTHEIWSYGGGDEALRRYLSYKYQQLRPGGALVIRDVIGPEAGEEEIYAWFEDSSGQTPPPEEALTYAARDLSTRGRFYKFAKEFFNGRGVQYVEEVVEGRSLVRAARKDVADFLSKKSYVENWESELHEDFTHWSFSRWVTELREAGFTVDVPRSRTYANPWVVEHHFRGTTELFSKEGKKLVAEPFPPTTVVLVAHK